MSFCCRRYIGILRRFRFDQLPQSVKGSVTRAIANAISASNQIADGIDAVLRGLRAFAFDRRRSEDAKVRTAKLKQIPGSCYTLAFGERQGRKNKTSRGVRGGRQVTTRECLQQACRLRRQRWRTISPLCFPARLWGFSALRQDPPASILKPERTCGDWSAGGGSPWIICARALISPK